jgi:hypothetical protein
MGICPRSVVPATCGERTTPKFPETGVVGGNRCELIRQPGEKTNAQP